MRKKIHPLSTFNLLAFAIAVFSGLDPAAHCANDCKDSTARAATSKSAKGAWKAQQERIARGKEIFLANQCLDCHLVAGKGSVDGVGLDGIAQKRTKRFLQEHLKDPEEHVAHNAKAFGGDPNLMTAPNLSKSEIDDVVAYLRSLPANPVLKLRKKRQ